RQVLITPPIAFVEQRQDASAIGTGFGPEHPVQAVRPCVGSCHTCGGICGAVSQIMLTHEVFVEGLVQVCHCSYSGIDEVHQIWKGITEKTTDAEGHVDARVAKLCQ